MGIGGMATISFGPYSTSLCTIALLVALASLLPDVASCRGYALFKRDKERIVSLVNKLKGKAGTDVKVSWDRKLENTAGLECECGMITHSSQTWGWAVVSRFQRHFQLYFGHEVGGLLGYTARTPGDPYENQIKDISTIVKGWYKKGGIEAAQLTESKRMDAPSSRHVTSATRNSSPSSLASLLLKLKANCRRFRSRKLRAAARWTEAVKS